MSPPTIVVACNPSRNSDTVLRALNETNVDAGIDVLRDGEAVVESFLLGWRRRRGPSPARSTEGWACDLLFLEWDLPRLDGLRVLRQLRWLQRDDPSVLPPIVILSQDGDGDLVSAAFRHGASGFLCTSIDSRQLVASVEQTVRYWLGATLRPPARRRQLPAMANQRGPSLLSLADYAAT